MPVHGTSRVETKVQAQRGGVELVDQLATEWIQLVRESPSDEPFYRPEWVRAYLRAFEPTGNVLLITARTGDRLSGLLPLVERGSFSRFPLRRLCGAGNVHTFRFDLVRCAGPDGDRAVTAIWEFLRDRGGWDTIEIPDVPEGGAAELLLEEALKDGFPAGKLESMRSPYIPLVGLAGAALIHRSTHFGQNLRRRMRKAQGQWNVRLSRWERADPAALQRFFALEGSGWKGTRGTAIACADSTRQFYEEIARAAERFGYFSMYLLEFGDQAVAGHYGLTYKGRYYSPKVAYDESYAQYGPGHLIVDAILRECDKHGVREFDFLGPWMEWKSEWTQRGRRHACCFIFRKGIVGKILYFIRFRLMQAIRKFVHYPPIAVLRAKWTENLGRSIPN